MTNCVGISARFVTRLTKRLAETNRVAKRVGVTKRVGEMKPVGVTKRVGETKPVGVTKRVGETKPVATHPLFTEVYDLNNIGDLLTFPFLSQSLSTSHPPKDTSQPAKTSAAKPA